MGKQVHHETVTTWVCDRCGKEDVFSETSVSESRRLPDGWACAVIFDEVQPVVKLEGDSYDRNWVIEEDGKAPVGTKIWCALCRKEIGLGRGKSTIAPDEQPSNSFFSRVLSWLQGPKNGA